MADWGAVWGNFAEFSARPRQRLVMDAIRKVRAEERFCPTAEGKSYLDWQAERVAAALGYTGRCDSSSSFRLDVFLASRAIDCREWAARDLTAARELALEPGDRLGTLVFRDCRVSTVVVVERVAHLGAVSAFAEGGSNRALVGVRFKRGARERTAEVTAGDIAEAIERAFLEGKRKDGYRDFLATRKASDLRDPIEAPAGLRP